MQQGRTLYFCGAGNSEGLRLAMSTDRERRRWQRLVLLDDAAGKLGKRLLGVEVAGPLSMLEDADADSSEVVNLVARTTAGRAAVSRRIASCGVPFATLVHPGVDTLGAELGEGVIVYEGAVIGPETVLGDGSVVFMRGMVGHESQVGKGCVIASGAVLNARVELEDEVYVGTNASILPEVKVGRGATIGSNTAVIEDVPAGATVIGVPGQVLVRGAEAVEHVEVGSEDSAARDIAGPGGETETLILEVFRQALRVETLSPLENFFDAGVTSLLALQVVTRLKAVTGLDLSAVDVFRFTCARKLARHLDGALVGAMATGASPGRVRSRGARAALRRRRRGGAVVSPR